MNSPALAAAFTAIDREFGPAGQIRDFKDRCDRIMRLGAGHPEVYLRYRRAAERFAVATLDTTIEIIDREYDCVIARRTLMRPYGMGPARLALEVLRELRLILRMVRRYAPERYSAILTQAQG